MKYNMGQRKLEFKIIYAYADPISGTKQAITIVYAFEYD